MTEIFNKMIKDIKFAENYIMPKCETTDQIF